MFLDHPSPKALWALVGLTFLHHGLSSELIATRAMELLPPSLVELAGRALWETALLGAFMLWCHRLVPASNAKPRSSDALPVWTQAILPLNLLLPLALLTRAAGPGAPVLFIAGSALILSWVALRIFKGVQGLYGLPYWANLLLMASPFAILAIGVVLLTSFVALAFFSLALRMFG